MGKDIFLGKKEAAIGADRRFTGSNFYDDQCLFNLQGLNGEDHHHFVVDEFEPHDHEDDDERRIYWESQHFLLQEIIEQYNSTGSKLREQIIRQIDLVRDSNFCNCPDYKNVTTGCTKCLRRATIEHLRTKGLTSSLSTSKWKQTHKTPGGTHEYIEVLATTQGRRKQIPFIVELNFRDEFKMAKACDEYNKLVNELPEIYVGKYEHLNAIIRVVCEAAKKSAEEGNIHMGPWRKRSFMQMKWSGSTSSSDHGRFNLDRPISDKIRISSPSQLEALNVRTYVEVA